MHNSRVLLALPAGGLLLAIVLVLLYIRQVSAPAAERYQRTAISGYVQAMGPRNRNTVTVTIRQRPYYLELPADAYRYLALTDSIDKKAGSNNLTIYKREGDSIRKIEWMYGQENGYEQIKKQETSLKKQ